MAPSRIAHDLNDGGFDSEVHLNIAQESLRHLQDAVRGLPEIEKEYEEALRALKDAPAGPVKDRMTKLAEDMKELKDALEGAPGKITELEADVSGGDIDSIRRKTNGIDLSIQIVMLRKYITAGKGKGHREGANVEEAKNWG
ncbi:MAG: hypothetical protein LQ343_002004 [Gyalolechia ehrenbergii]|nr:MAG: hypothetical protein LQ343_002004 [Gyalolechia ehrenbergii]